MNRLPTFSTRRAQKAQTVAPIDKQSLQISRLLLWMMAALLAVLATTSVLAQDDGYTYTVQPGDNWSSVALRVGLTVKELRAANPQAIRSTGWLIVGEKLFIPTPPEVKQVYYEVQRGDGWSMIAKEYGIPTRLLQAANPRSLRAGQVLYVGERLLIPTAAEAQPTSATTPTPTDEPVEEAAVVEVVVVTDEPTAEPAEGRTSGQTEESTPEATVDPLSLLPECPLAFEEYPPAILAVLNSGPTGRDLLITYLETCGIDESAAITPLDLGDDGEDVILTYETSETDARSSVARRSELLILSGDAAEGFEVAYTAYAAGSVELLSTEDINNDDRPDVVWIDTTCGASTCFDTVYVRSWDGSSWRDWTEGTVTMASAEVTLTDADDSVDGQELQITGGQYGSFGAGPQRVRTEIWGSVDGGPYTMLSETFESSDCLYHTILDANQAFAAADFDAAQTLYERAASDESLTACWTRADELDELRSFAWFRLGLITGYRGEVEDTEALIAQLVESYADMPYADIGQRWLDAYLDSGDLKVACTQINEYAAGAGAAAVEMLADYGYANPSFAAGDVCPILSVDAPTIEPRGDGTSDATSSLSRFLCRNHRA